MAKHLTAEQWGEKFAERRGVYMAYTAAMESLLRTLLDGAGIPFVQIEGRTKEVENFVGKLKRKQGKYDDPLDEVTDLTGVRIVLYYLDDLDRTGDLITREFSADLANSVDKRQLLDPDRFGYLSVHHIVKPSEQRRSLPEWEPFADLACEIQVRTVLQHAWGAISRKLSYASVQEAPRTLQRSLNRLSALLELADDEFVSIRESREQIEATYDRELERGNLDLEIDDSSVEIYLRDSEGAKRMAEIAVAAGSPPRGIRIAADGTSVEDQGFDDEDEFFRDFQTIAKRLGYRNIADLDRRLNELWAVIPGLAQAINSGYRDSDGSPMEAFPANWLALVLLWADEAPREMYHDYNYADELVDVILEHGPPAP